MPRKKSNPEALQQKIREAGQAEVRADGQGEQPALQQVLSERFVNASTTESAQMMQTLNQLLLNQQQMTEAMLKMNERLQAAERTAVRFEEDRKKFLDEMQAQYEKLKIKDPDEQARFRAKSAEEVQHIYQQSVADAANQRLTYLEFLNTRPRELIVSPGETITKSTPAGPMIAVIPEEMRINGVRFVFQPGVPTEVPDVVAQEYRSRMNDRALAAKRQALLDGSNIREETTVAGKWDELRDALPFQVVSS